MAINFGKGKETLFASTDLMSFGKAFSRMAAQPLDMYEVWYDYDALVAYAANTDSATATAYVGQKVAYIDADNKVTHYSIEADGSLKELGVTPVGDNNSIVVDENGTISLKGVGTLVFEREVEGKEEKEEVKFQPLMTKDGLVWVEPSKTTVEGLAVLIEELTGRVNSLEAKVGKAAEGETAATGLFKEIADEVVRATTAEEGLENRIEVLEQKEDQNTTYSVKENEKVLSLDGTVFGTTLKLNYSDSKIKLLGINDAVVSEISAADFIADGVLEDVDYDAENNKLIFTWNVIDPATSEKKKVEVDVTDLVDTYHASNGLQMDDHNNISILIPQEEKYLSARDAGLVTTGIDDAISAAEGRASLDAANQVAAAEDRAKVDATNKANQAKSDAIADADAKLANKANTNDVYAKTETYNKTQIDELLEGIQAGSSESAATVASKLEAFKKTINAEVYGNEAGTGDSRIDTLESTTIKSVARSAGSTKIKVDTDADKKVVIDDSELVAAITAAQNTANSANTIAGENKTQLATLAQTVSEHTTRLGDHGNRLVTAEQTIIDQGTSIGSIRGSIQTINENLTAYGGLINTNTSDITTIKGQISSLDSRVTINEGDITNLKKALAGYTGENAVKNAFESATQGIAAAQKKADDNATEISGLQTTVSEQTKKIDVLEEAKASFEYNIQELHEGLGSLDKNFYEHLDTQSQKDVEQDKALTDYKAEMVEILKEYEVNGSAENALGQAKDYTDAEIQKLDATVSSAEVETGRGVKVTVTQVDGKVTAVAVDGNFDNRYDATGSAAAALTSANQYSDQKLNAVVEQYLTGDGAADTIDTLNEIANWINTDEAGVAKIIKDVENNAKSIENINKTDVMTSGITAAKVESYNEIVNIVNSSKDSWNNKLDQSTYNTFVGTTYSTLNEAVNAAITSANSHADEKDVNIAKGVEAQGWGNHANAGYAKDSDLQATNTNITNNYSTTTQMNEAIAAAINGAMTWQDMPDLA